MSVTELFDTGTGDINRGFRRRFLVTGALDSYSAGFQTQTYVTGAGLIDINSLTPSAVRITGQIDKNTFYTEADYARLDLNYSPTTNPDDPANSIKLLELSFQTISVELPCVLRIVTSNSFEQVRVTLNQPVRQTMATVRLALNTCTFSQAQAITAQQGKFHVLTGTDKWLFEGCDVDQTGPSAYRYTYHWATREVLKKIPEFFTQGGGGPTLTTSQTLTPRDLQPFEQVRWTIFPSAMGEVPQAAKDDYWFQPTTGDPSGLPGNPTALP